MSYKNDKNVKETQGTEDGSTLRRNISNVRYISKLPIDLKLLEIYWFENSLTILASKCSTSSLDDEAIKLPPCFYFDLIYSWL